MFINTVYIIMSIKVCKHSWKFPSILFSPASISLFKKNFLCFHTRALNSDFILSLNHQLSQSAALDSEKKKVDLFSF